MSDLFRREREYAERSGANWFILSAKYGLVAPDQIIEPYELHLAKTPTAYRTAWGVGVVDQLQSLAPLDGKVVELHAGAAYANAIRELLTAKGAQTYEPLIGLGLGQRLAWYRRSLGKDAHDRAREGSAQSHVQRLVRELTDQARALTPADFLAQNGVGLRSPGLYTWWVDQPGAVDLTAGLGHEILPGLIYAGLAGATRTRSGKKSKNTVWGRIQGMHLGGRHEFSTFRLTLGSILANLHEQDEIDEIRLTVWMHQHLRVLAIAIDDGDTLGDLETAILNVLDPQLNLAKMAKNHLRVNLSALRKQHRKG